MQRRHFLRGAPNLLLSSPLAGIGCSSDPSGGNPTYHVPHSAMSGTHGDFELELNTLSGQLPSDLAGHLFVVAGVPRGDGAHLFAGEGHCMRLDFGNPRPRLLGVTNRTPDHYVDLAVHGTADAFQSRGMIRSSPTLGFRAQLNTAWLSIGRRLLLTIDAGRPFEIDPVSLRLVTPVGHRDRWTPAFPMTEPVPFPLHLTSAHPAHDPNTGETFTVNFGFGTSSFLDLVRFDRTLGTERFGVVDEDGTPIVIQQTVHQLAVTANHVLLADTSFVVEPTQRFDENVASPQKETTQLYLIRRSELAGGTATITARAINLQAELLHFIADYDDDDGRITLHTAHIPGTDVSEWLRAGDRLRTDEEVAPELVGMFPSPLDRGGFATVAIDTTSYELVPGETRIVEDDRFTWGLALYAHRSSFTNAAPTGRIGSLYWSSVGLTPNTLSRRMMDLYAERSNRAVPFDALPPDGRPATLSRFDIERGILADGYEFPPGFYGASPQFAPVSSGTGETDGYLITTAVSDRPHDGSSGDEFWIFAANDLAAGPICRLGHPDLNMPFTVHSAWLDALESAPGENVVSVADDYADALSDPRLRQLFEDHVFPHFPE